MNYTNNNNVIDKLGIFTSNKNSKSIKIKQIIENGIVLNKYKTIKLPEILYACIFGEYPDFIECLYDYVKSCKKLNKEINILSKSQTKDNIDNELGHLYGPKFMRILKQYNCIIAGSYVLSHLTNKSFESDDIDIYVNASQRNSIDIQLRKYLRSYTTKYKCLNVNTTTYNLKDIHHIYNYNFVNNDDSDDSKKLKNIQLICVDKSVINLKHFITENFDYSFCQVWYDGENIESSNSLELIKKNIGYINPLYLDECFKIRKIGNYEDRYKYKDEYECIIANIKKKQFNQNSVYRITQTISRYFKYVNRGFNITDIEDLFEILKKLEINKKDIDTNYYIL